jgi:glycosyltransferase involved in cell wall biosynthesis
MMVLGLIGLSAMTWLFPVIGYLWSFFAREGRGGRSDVAGARLCLRKISVLIPAHDEETTISGTLLSVKLAAGRLKEERPDIEVEVVVGADGCTDKTAMIARGAADIVLESKAARGKWATLKNLVLASSGADWLVFADAGILWSDDLLLKAVVYAERPEVLGFAPAYRNPSAGKLEAAYWKIESSLKKLENAAGGPVLVHGPTVMYRRQELVDIFRSLDSDGKTWINDDVALSMSLRLKNPHSIIVYDTSARVYDSAESQLDPSTGKAIRQFGRRKRIILGNLQCLGSILAPHWKENPLAALISLRLAFRMFWALWGGFVIIGLMATLGLYALAECLAFTLSVALFVAGYQPMVGLFEAGLASALVPYYIVTREKISKWK